jgi:hypothetical protein
MLTQLLGQQAWQQQQQPMQQQHHMGALHQVRNNSYLVVSVGTISTMGKVM